MARPQDLLLGRDSLLDSIVTYMAIGRSQAAVATSVGYLCRRRFSGQRKSIISVVFIIMQIHFILKIGIINVSCTMSSGGG